MGWFSRRGTEPTKPDSVPVPPAPAAQGEVPPAPSEPVPAPTAAPAPESPPAPTAGSSTEELGRYGPRVRITGFEGAPPELTWQLPVRGELYRVMPGADRPDYSLMLLERPLLLYPAAAFDVSRVGQDRLVQDRQGRPMVRVHALVLCARFVGQQLHPGMVDLPVNVAYVIDQSLARDATVDPAKIEYAAVGFLSEGAAEADRQSDGGDGPAGERAPGLSPPGGEPADLVEHVGHEVAQLLRQGVAEHRGAPVERLQATVSIDAANRISGLTGNADGTAPEPTPGTFERINAALTRLGALPPGRAVSTLTLHVIGPDITVTTTPRS